MAARRSSYPLASSSPSADSVPHSRPLASRRITDLNGREDSDDDYQDEPQDYDDDFYADIDGDADWKANAHARLGAQVDGITDDDVDDPPHSSPTVPSGSTVNGSTHSETPTADGPKLSQQQLVEYRERLIRDLELRDLSAQELHLGLPDKTRVAPILEDAVLNSPYPTSSAFTSTSTESGNTIRGGMTPAPIAGTPSYPFPRMTLPPGSFGPSGFSLPPAQASAAPGFSRSPHAMALEHRGVLDRVLSETSTPASAMTFQPGATPQPEGFDFPTPNLYDLSLMLSAEPGLDAWWGTVVQIMREVYQAERVTLAVPADTTDIENVPWGQKATYNEHEQDDLSMNYLAKGGTSALQSTVNDALDDVFASPAVGTPLDGPKRPTFASRHSFTAFEENKDIPPEGITMAAPRRPTYLTRSQTHSPSIQTAADRQGEPHAKLNKSTLEQHDIIEEEQQQQQHIPSWEASFVNKSNSQGRVLPVLQALDYEADPLIDNTGVMRVLERGRPVALTRNYPYLAPAAPAAPSTGPAGAFKPGPRTPGQELPRKPKNKRSDSATKLSSIFSGPTGARASVRSKVHFGDTILDDDSPRPPTPKYEEYEQTPPSPWSQSPAPSPAVRPDPKENPFFADATVDEDSFNPDPTPTDYASMRPPEAIGVDHSWTVLHIPLSLAVPSKLQPHPFKLDATAMHQKSHSRSSQSPESTHHISMEPEVPKRDKPAPIAILSILSPVIPYPSNLRHSLEHLAPHLAATFSLCRHYTNLETELAGLKRRRPSTAGFGAVTAFGRPMESGPFLAADETAVLQQSLAGSITSPSDYSGISKSTTGSPTGTPGWDSGALVYLAERRQPAASPAGISQTSGGYFGSKLARQSSQRSRAGSKDDPPGEVRPSRLAGSKTPQTPQAAVTDADEVADRHTGSSDEPSSTKDAPSRNSLEGSIDLDAVSADKYPEPSKVEQAPSKKGHTLLHSYGADFASTFQSLPPGASLPSRPLTSNANVLQRSNSFIASAADMPPPSDKLKGLILDSLPAQVFVALPQTGEIVWVNSRYLSYRGQTVADLSADPWGSIHPDEREDYLKAWSHSLRTGEQFSSTVRIKRFDGAYRWFYARAVASRDKRGAVVQFLGSYLDIHEQRIAEIKAARQQEVEASEAKHRLLANLIPQIIFTATEEDGVTFANEQWLSYTGQSFEDSLRLGFLDFVHPEDLARCRIPSSASSQPTSPPTASSQKGSGDTTSTPTGATRERPAETPGRGPPPSSKQGAGGEAGYHLANPDIAELAKKGVIKVGTDSNGRLSYTTEVRLRSKTGEYRWHLVRCVEIDTIDFGSGASSYFGSATDINDHKLLEAKLKEAMESKGRFLSNMSHEIRTPLIGISGMVSFLQDTTLNEEQRDYTNTIQTSANSLIMIINDILDLSKVDAGMMKLRYEWFHTRSLIEDVNELVSTMAISKRLELNYLVDADVPAWVKGDRVRIRQVLLNVIGNAIKFTSEGEVFSQCKVYRGDDAVVGEHEIMLEFIITDTGRGFSEEEKALIFKPFSQIDESSTRQHGGSGLGLVISRQLVELHGGKMEGNAVMGKGSTFTFTARCSLPTLEDRPPMPNSPGSTATAVSPVPATADERGHHATLPALPPTAPLAQNAHAMDETGIVGPEFLTLGADSTGSSSQSPHSGQSLATDRSSITSMNTGLARFSEAAKASGQDLSQMKLEMPSDRSSTTRSATPEKKLPAETFRPPMYLILLICPQTHSREATTQHIEMTLPKDVPHQITAVASLEEAEAYIGGEDPIRFTHIVINLGEAEAVISVMDKITKSQKMDSTMILILSDSVQRQEVMKYSSGTKYEKLFSDKMVNFIYKPVKPSRFAVIFDPDRRRDLSTDWNRSTAQQMLESQKASSLELQKRMGNKGFRVLLVEDNPVNQKVMTKFLMKVAVDVDIAVDGAECVERVFSKPHNYYSLILCDLHMPRKDGYQACREIREWEMHYNYPQMPIIALSANVMSDVQEKCAAAGFSDYVTKPVDFIDLSRAMSRFF
ncbi:histidine kinase [Trichoderma citrinoviride]|uniref:histidine kinase n=1 Tax=Trichoderma citrinoviride TaxID=58853 RepID=A0A2T4BAY1_9HYPO|nr:histidine kinase [Trichoderma citrinoviride]PTB66476.1 histidine kinase [Trichoderma citrinoviride]